MENANLLTDWRKLSGNELCFLYVKYKETNDINLDSCLSGIICKFWNVATKAYHAQGIKLASPEECYNWLIDSIQYVLDHHVWTNPEHQMYNDPKAPEKAINVVFNSTKINYFVALTRQKRKIDATSISLDSISEEASDSYFLPVFDNYNLFEDELFDVVKNYYSTYEYFNAICLDLIINEDLVDKSDDFVLKYKRLKWRLKQINDDYAKLFSAIYGFDYSDVKRSVKYISSLSNEDLDTKINRFVNELKHNIKVMDIFE